MSMKDMDKNLNKPLINRPFEVEFTIHTSRSSGPGGQHVNKTETKVELRFHVENSKLLTDEEKECNSNPQDLSQDNSPSNIGHLVVLLPPNGAFPR
jgi:protein subunit release factor B